ncbi:hypothetical protein [Streptomyces yaizuensis]|uniref:Membrane protein n=1 Tax=Streptomyces yaizuensis TaxID=2989713 RepID=A0ABQ5NVB6_9ACTN|nr:hypothetical protein [Streptomyces sp. YSPA8]GLF94145.1 membrane protein [Streptomyces sp. YSPA8]
MAEQHDADREPQPIDEEAAWAAIVAGYGEEPVDPPGAKPFRSVEDLARLEAPKPPEKPASLEKREKPEKPEKPERSERSEKPDKPDKPEKPEPESASDAESAQGPGAAGQPPALGSSIVFAPGVGGAGPRDYQVAEAKDDDLDASDEGHFVPPEPPPLPEADTTAKFAWLGVIGGPVLMLLAVLFGWHMTWWLTTLCVGGFLGGFITLVARMSSGDDEDEDPGRGAVV